nr:MULTISPECIES: ribonuclease P protein component [Helcobacillus]
MRHSDDFRLTSRTGTRAARSHVVVHVAVPDPHTSGPRQQDEPRVGFVVSKKVGNSVIRHRVTRRLREIMRPRMHLLPPRSTCVVRALPGIQSVQFQDLAAQTESAVAAAVTKLQRRTDGAQRTRRPA